MSENVENMCNSTTELTESEQHHLEQTATNSMLHNHCKNKLFVEKRQYLRHQLESLGTFTFIRKHCDAVVTIVS